MQHDLPSTGTSGPVPAIDLSSEIANASLILAATVVRVSNTDGDVTIVSQQAQPDYDQLREAELVIVRVLAGEPPGNLLRVFFLAGKVPSRPWAEPTLGQTVLLFLRSVDAGYVPVVPTETPIQTLPDIAPPPANASRSQAIAHELEQIILKADPGSATGMIISATLAHLELPGNVDLHLLDTPALHNRIRRAAWVAIALAESQIAALDEVPALFANPAPPSAEALWSLIVHTVSQLKAAEARPQLVALLHSQHTALARAAATALRQLHDPSAESDLVRALDYPDQEVRYQAVLGLAELEPDVEAGPSFELYRTNEPHYIQKWKQWWKKSGH